MLCPLLQVEVEVLPRDAPLGRVPGRGVGAVGKSPAVATAESLAEAGDLSTAVVTVAVLGRVGLRDTTLTQGPPR